MKNRKLLRRLAIVLFCVMALNMLTSTIAFAADPDDPNPGVLLTLWQKYRDSMKDEEKEKEKFYTVTFDANGEDVENLPEPQKVAEGKCAVEPSEPTRGGFKFNGWFTDKNAENKFDFSTPINADLYLYANWNNNSHQPEKQQEELDRIAEINNGILPEIILDEEDSIPSFILGKYSNVKVSDYESAIRSLKDIENLMMFTDVENEFIGSDTRIFSNSTHYILQQYYQGYTVYGKQLVITTDDNENIIALSGNYDPISYVIDLSNNILETEAYDIASSEYDMLDVDGTLIIYTIAENYNELAWLFTGNSSVFVSAVNGEILEAYSNIITEYTEAIGSGENEDGIVTNFNTVFDDNNTTITSDDTYVFYDSVRNITYRDLNGINSNTLGGWQGLHDSFNSTMKDSDNIWESNANAKAISLSSNLSDVYDYYLNVIGLMSYNGNGGAIYAYINDMFDNGGNAFNWGPSNNVTLLSFGQNVSFNRQLDVVGHEFTHAIQRSLIPSLDYANETGALMEGYSDIAGELVEIYMNGTTNWIHGNRNIKEPHKVFLPSKLDGVFYGDEVHHNSTVISHTVYNIYQKGLNDVYELTELLYRAWHYLSATASFIDYRMAMIAAARDMELSTEKVEYIKSSFDKANIKPENYDQWFFTTNTINFNVVSNTSTQSPISNAEIKIERLSDGAVVAITYCDNSGNASVDLRSSTYQITISAPGFESMSYIEKYDGFTVSSYFIKLTESSIQDDLICELGGNVKDATTGSVVSGVIMRFRKGYNIRSGRVTLTLFTDSNGKYYTNNLKYGYYTVELVKEGYISSYVVLQSSVTNWSEAERTDALNQNLSISPLLSNDDEIRIELTWGATPRDLDSHLVGPTDDGGQFHEYYPSRNDGSDADLDVDDIDSYGPETITIHKTYDGMYVYAVHDYTNRSSNSSKALANSGATVKIYRGNSVIITYNVPLNEDGTLWTVFSYDSLTQTFTTIGDMSYESNVGNVLQSEASDASSNTGDEVDEIVEIIFFDISSNPKK